MRNELVKLYKGGSGGMDCGEKWGVFVVFYLILYFEFKMQNYENTISIKLLLKQKRNKGIIFLNT